MQSVAVSSALRALDTKLHDQRKQRIDQCEECPEIKLRKQQR